MTRIVTAVLLAMGACYLVFLSPPAVFGLAALYVGATCYQEFKNLVGGHGIPRPGVFGVAAGIVILYAPQYTALGLSLITIAALSWALRRGELREVLPQVAAEIFGAIYTFLPWHFAELLRARSVHWLFFALALNWAGDTAAYYVGRALGKHRLAPIVSPNKSWEGAAGSVAGSILFGVLYTGYFASVSWWKIAAIALAGNVAGQLGDLAESAMKRGAGVKDSGSLLPGHGGLLDRLDSSLFALPVVFALSLLLFSHP